MKYALPRIESRVSRKGAVAVMAAIFLIVIFAFTAFTIDLGYVMIVDQELQSAVDSSALAAAQELQIADDEAVEKVRKAAKDLAEANNVNGKGLKLRGRQDVEVGVWDPITAVFTPMPGAKLSETNAVRVTGQLNKGRRSQVDLFFAPLLGHNEAAMETSAIAVINQGLPRDVILVIDCSGSMASYNRMSYTIPAAQTLCNELGEDDRLALVVYSYPVPVEESENGGPGPSGRIAPPIDSPALKGGKGNGGRNNGGRNNGGRNNGGGNNGGGSDESETRLTGFLERPLSLNHSPVKNRLPDLRPGLYASRTNIAGGMRVAIEEFLAKPRNDRFGRPVEQVMVLMTDGHANETEPPATSPVHAIDYYANLANDNDIVIHGITLGQGADKKSIEEAAELTEGQYYHVDDGDFEGLFEVYRGIGRGGDNPRLVR